MFAPLPRLLVVTPAHNEEGTLRAMAASMAAQTLRPTGWVIVNDRSNDSTGAVADEIAHTLDFVEVLHREDSTDSARHFAGKVSAFDDGYRRYATTDVDFVGCVDADVILPPYYFERVVQEFNERPLLGVTGGVYVDPSGNVGRHGGGSVPGPAQVFRHETFEQIGGFRPLMRGGEDALACSYARMNGWETEAINDLQFHHLRAQGTGGGASRLRAAFAHGRQDWDVGIDPLFEIVRMVPRLKQKPRGLVVASRLAGYAFSALGRSHEVDPDIISFTRREQRRRMVQALKKYVRRLR